MEKHTPQPVIIRFNSSKEAIDLYISIQLKYFIKALMYRHEK